MEALRVASCGAGELKSEFAEDQVEHKVMYGGSSLAHRNKFNKPPQIP